MFSNYISNIISSNDFFIKRGYKSRLKPDYYFDSRQNNIIYQPHVYELAAYLAKKNNVEKIIDIGIGNGDKLFRYFSGHKLFGIDYGNNIKNIQGDKQEIQVIEANLDESAPNIEQSILEDSCIICADVIEHLVRPNILLNWLKKISSYPKLMIFSTPERDLTRGYESFGPPENSSHVREWSISELNQLLVFHGLQPDLLGLTINNNYNRDKKTIISIHDNVFKSTKEDSDCKILAIITCYNEEDIIGQTIKYLIDQNIYVHCIDNWSTDNSINIIKNFAKSNPLVTYEQFPAQNPSKTYDWHDLLKKVELVARNSDAKWIIHHDADEVRESPFINFRNLSQGIKKVNQTEFNAIDFTCIDFVPTKDGFCQSDSPVDFFTHFRFGNRSGHFQQIKAWKNTPNIDLASSGGHCVNFDNRKVFPYKFLLKHYPIRSTDQGKNKIFRDRLPRWNKKEKLLGWHNQYDKITPEYNFIGSENCLIKYDKVNFYYNYLVERISGIGITQEIK